MADAFTARLNLTKVEVNASQNTWGAKINANMDAIDGFALALDARLLAFDTLIATTRAQLAPIQSIVIWNSVSAPPAGWLICNGQNGTPDLRDRFIVGAGTSYAPGAIGGTNFVSLTPDQNGAHVHGVIDAGHAHAVYDPGHAHGGTTDAQGVHAHAMATSYLGPFNGANFDSSGGAPGGSFRGDNVQPSGLHSHNIQTSANPTNIAIYSNGTGITIGNAGSGNAHENRPPFYALYYIIRVA